MAANGEGANLALFDGAELGKALVAHPGDIDAAIPGYKKHRFPRTTVVGAETQELLLTLFGQDTTHSLVEMFTQPQP
ncbi:hypothetical protein FS594_28045 (plasmid) [Rahnella aquatilis]|nr:hypothetical protein FS594_28045 [Rahnella aquatilis]